MNKVAKFVITKRGPQNLPHTQLFIDGEEVLDCWRIDAVALREHRINSFDLDLPAAPVDGWIITVTHFSDMPDSEFIVDKIEREDCSDE